MSSAEGLAPEPKAQLDLLGRRDLQVQRIRAEAYGEIADRVAAWEFPPGSDALSPICLLVADLRRRADA